jgi:signal transduction histidine kinase
MRSTLRTVVREKTRSPKSMTSLLKNVVSVLQDILEPSGTCLVFGYGFRSLVLYWDNQDGKASGPVFYQGDGKKEEGAFYSRFNTECDFPAYPLRGFARGRSVDGGTFTSALVLAVPKKDKPHKPTLGRDQLFGHSVADLVVSAISEGYSLLTGRIVDALQRSLDKEVSDPKSWFQALRLYLCQDSDASPSGASLSKYGAKWLGATLEGEDDYLGVGYILMLKLKQGTKNNKLVEVHHLIEPWEGAHSVITLVLDSSNARLFLGFEPRGLFSGDKERTSPWYSFLERVCNVADASLARIRFQQIKKTSVELENMAHRSILQSLWLHELGNKSAELTTTIQIASESLALGDIDQAQEDLNQLFNAARNFSRVTKQINSPVVSQNLRNTYPLDEVVNEVTGYYHILLESRGIQTEKSIPEEIELSIDYAIVYLALSNLISNAIKAIPRNQNGLIMIRAWQDEETINCQITNNGPTIDPVDHDRIFDPGFSTHKEHSGYGLTASRKALHKLGGDLTLDTGYSGGARFLLVLPSN